MWVLLDLWRTWRGRSSGALTRQPSGGRVRLWNQNLPPPRPRVEWPHLCESVREMAL